MNSLVNALGAENLVDSVTLRAKKNETIKSRKRLSEPVFSAQGSPALPAPPESIVNLFNRRSLRFLPAPSTLKTIHQGTSLAVADEPRKLFLVRHGERVDSTFGSNWLEQVIEKSTGTYRRINLNLPKRLVTRKDLKDFLFDPPITELGLHQCRMMGEELAAQGIQIDHVYSSPALRCVQTADQILQGLQRREQVPIRLEPCLFEFLKWYPVIPVKWPFMDAQELTQNGYHIEKSYQPFYPIESLRKDEDELMYYNRSHFITTSILKNHQLDRGNVLIVGHVSLSLSLSLF